MKGEQKEATIVKERITVTIDKELLVWLDQKIDSKVFANRSHGLEFLIKRKMEDEHGQ
jgi:metal-responsive CopG/Arc/MetJ family transcriptional regulator